jgi:hypothetical protein
MRSRGESNIPDLSRTTSKTCKIKLLDWLTVEIVPQSKSILFFPGQTYVHLKPNSQGTIIIGKGILN